MRDPMHTTECEVIYTHAYVHADIPNTNTRIVHTMHKRVPLMRAGYVLYSPERLECGVVGKCCSNVLRSFIAYGVPLKAVRTCVCEKNDTAHVHSSRCAIPYIQRSARSYTPVHTCMPTYQIQTRVYALHVYLPSLQCITQ
jgi:hypothetical protein